MNVKSFLSSAITVFPAANSKIGGQLLTEENIRSRSSVQRERQINYFACNSYTHNDADFEISVDPGDSTRLIISGGECILNGHYLRYDAEEMSIDIAELNANAIAGERLSGIIYIGLKAMYATQQTIAGSILTETTSTDGIFEGVQVVLKSATSANPFYLPEDVSVYGDNNLAMAEDELDISAHLYLGKIAIYNGQLQSATLYQNPYKTAYIPADRIKDIDNLISSTYVTKTRLNQNILYTFAGQGTDSQGYDTWQGSNDSLMVWDKTPSQLDISDPENAEEIASQSRLQEARFQPDFKIIQNRDNSYGSIQSGVVLAVPHKQPNGSTVFYENKYINLPTAEYKSGTAGVVDYRYTQHIKNIAQEVNNLYNIGNGKMRAYIAELNDRSELPPINVHWHAGDYVIVREDNTVERIGSTSTSELNIAPSTMYVVTPTGLITGLEYIANYASEEALKTAIDANTNLTGVQINNSPFMVIAAPSTESGILQFTYSQSTGYPNFNTTNPQYFGDAGTVQTDFVVMEYIDPNTQEATYYLYSVARVDPSTRTYYPEPVYLTGTIGLATEEQIGGFVNVPDTALGNGYIYCDPTTGTLRLLDYDILSTGVYGYSLHGSHTFGENLTSSAIQEYIDENINERVALYTTEMGADSSYTYPVPVVHLYMTLPREDTETVISIHDVDSRNGTYVYLHILGDADSNTVIDIVNCKKIRIDDSIIGSPRINLYNCNLYYDSAVLGYAGLDTVKGLELWYYRFTETDPNLQLDGMTVSTLDFPADSETSVDLWTTNTDNDYTYSYAIKGVTFDRDGNIVGMQIYMRTNATTNNVLGTYILIGEFRAPQSSTLSYPVSRMNYKIRVDGSFISAYTNNTTGNYTLEDITFTATTGKYDGSAESPEDSVIGTISIKSTSEQIANTNIQDSVDSNTIPGLVAGTYHVFEGFALNE